MGGHQPARLVKQEQRVALARRQWLAIDGDDVVGGDIERRRIDHAAVDRDAALHDPFLGVAARGQPGPRHPLGDPLTGFLFARRTRRAALVGRALAIGAAAAEGGAFCKYLAVVLIVAARTLGVAIERARFAARMFLPVGATFRALTRPVELRPLAERPVTLGAILARARETRTLLAAADFAWLVEARFV